MTDGFNNSSGPDCQGGCRHGGRSKVPHGPIPR
jgi:hypothetical protein